MKDYEITLNIPGVLVDDAQFDLVGHLARQIEQEFREDHPPPSDERKREIESRDAKIRAEAREREADWMTTTDTERQKIWESIPVSVRADLVIEAGEVIARNDYEGLNAPYGDDAEALAFYIAVRSSTLWPK